MNKRKCMKVLLTVFICIVLMPVKVWAKDIGIAITAPSDAETNIITGRSFYVMGTFDGGDALRDGDEVRVELQDASGRSVRSVSTTIMNNTNMYIDYPGLSYYGDDKTELLSAGMPDLIWDGKDEHSFHNGDCKLYYNEQEFAALISGGEGELSEQMDMVDGSGKPYELLKDGTYTIIVSIMRGSDIIGTSEKQMTIGADADKILSRFSPTAHREKLNAFAQKNQYKIYTDLFPGYWSKGDVFCEILPAWRAADASEYLKGKAHFVIYNVKESSATYAVEVAIMQKMNAIEDPDRMQCYYYEFGEPILPDESGTESEIVPFEEGDKLELVRAETIITDTSDNVYNQDEPEAVSYDLNVEDGIKASVGETIAIYGVTAPIQIDDADIADQGDNSYQLKNKISEIQYHITGDSIDVTLKKEVNLNRLSGGWDNYSTLEFKHDIPITEDMLNQTLHIEVSGFDVHGQQIEGTKEQFDLSVDHEMNIVAPVTGDRGLLVWYIALIALSSVVVIMIVSMNRKKQ